MDEEKYIVKTEVGDRAETLGSLILRVSVKTLLALLIIIVLAVAIGGCFFPKIYFDIYRHAGLMERASYYGYVSAVSEKKTHTVTCDGKCAYSRLLGESIDCLYPEVTQATAQKLFDMTDEYLSLSCHEEHSAVMDEKYVSSVKNLAYLSIIYGYDDYVYGARMKALCLTDDASANARVSGFGADSGSHALNELIAYAENCDDFVATDDEGAISVYQKFTAIAESETVMPKKASLLYRLYRLACDYEGSPYFDGRVNDAKRNYYDYVNLEK